VEHTAILQGGPADGRVMATRDQPYHIKFQQLDPDYRLTMTAEAMIEPLPVITHVYEPVRTVTVYAHVGAR